MGTETEKVPVSAVHEKGKAPVVVYEERVKHGTEPVAFRCVSCGHLIRAASAGEDYVPHACDVCGRGVIFARDEADVRAQHPPAGTLSDEEFQDRLILNPPWGVKFLIYENWEVLAHADDARLEELGIAREAVAAHNPPRGGRGRGARFGRAHERFAEDGVKVEDRAG